MGRKEPGSLRFERTYSLLWGERWKGLKEALLAPPRQVALTEGLLKPYYLDEASLEPPRLLEVLPGMSVLDLCAAPGGKSLVLALALNGSGELHLNDLSADRIRRLRQVIESHLPDTLKNPVTILRGDGSLMGRKTRERYDRILLDAPCSSERHVITSPRHLEEWGPGRIKSLSIRQFALLCSALDMLKTGGLLVYSTCSLHNSENDGIIERLLERRKGLCEVLDKTSPLAEKTPMGSHILPDSASGRGPIYLSVIRKT